MIFHPADNLTLSLFGALTVLNSILALRAWRKSGASKRYLFILVAYLFTFSVVVISGAARTFMVPVAPFLFISVAVMSIYLARSDFGAKVAAVTSWAGLVGFQGFRLPLELILHHWASIQTVPPTMTWTGQNWDIVAGALALIGAPIANRYREVVWICQVIGAALLVNVIRVAVMSMPFPFAWPLENPLQLILYFPYALIGPLCVGAALFAHLVTFRKLRSH